MSFCDNVKILMVAAVVLLGDVAVAAGPSGPAPDMSSYATKDDVAATADSMRAQIPQPASSKPPMEVVGGTVGTAGTYRPADATQPRLTRSKTLTLGSDGTATFDWSAQGALASPVQVALTPVYSGIGVPKCWATAVTATSVTVKCVIEAISTLTLTGIAVASISNGSATGVLVGVIALPSS